MIAPGPVPGREFERIVSVAPYGFRLWDPVAGRAVTDGLEVTLRTPVGRPIRAAASPSGVFGIHGAAGLDRFQDGPGDDAFWGTSWPRVDIGTIEVRDPLGRYLPFSFRPEAPARIGQVAREVCADPAGAVLGLRAGSPPALEMPVIPLFSSTARATPQGMARVSAQLETSYESPAAGALVVVRPHGERPAYGLADERGAVVVFIPYPRPVHPLLSPPSTDTTSLAGQYWDDVAVGAFWSPHRPSPYPDICELLAQQENSPVALLAGTSPAAELTSVRLEFGVPLDLRTDPLSVLIVEAGSPPSP